MSILGFYYHTRPFNLQTTISKEITQGVTVISQAIAKVESMNFELDIKRRDDLQELQRNLTKAINGSTAIGRDIANRIDGFASEKEPSENKRSKVLAKLVEFRKLEIATKEISETAETVRKDQEILRRLHFDHLQTRHRAIEEAHSKTFQWAFEQQNKGLRFREWLENDNNVFWVYGKPGSGKSTFMKFLCDNEDTRNCLQRWSGEKGLIIAKFFFWNAGSNLQKSQEGLLRSLLFEILRQCPELMPAVKNAVAEISDSDKPDPLQYTHNLMHLYQRIAIQQIPLKFCFFVDGLDEFQEEHRSHLDLIKFLRQLELSSDIKLCVSSRPWTVFVDEFGTSLEWTLKLEDLTRDDIRHYVKDKFDEHPQFKALTHMNRNYYQVVDAVADRAQGVFLWVYLVVRNLLNSLTYHDSVSTLYQRLQEFPPDLESFFQRLIDSVEPVYRKHMARYFKVATIADEPLFAMVYSYLDDIDENPDFAIDLALSELSHEQIGSRRDQLRRRLDGRSRGLLEMFSSRAPQSSDRFFEYRVDFIHRTVHDFLQQSKYVQSLLEYKAGSETPLLTTCHAILSVMKTGPFGSKEHSHNLFYLIPKLFFFISKALAENPDSEIALEHIVDAAEASYKLVTSRTDIQYEAFLITGLAARIDFYSYVRRKLAANPTMLRKAPSNPLRAVSKSALYHALQNSLCPLKSTRTVALLLEAGDDPNYSIAGGTVWTNLLHQFGRQEFVDKESARELIRLLLLHGADLGAKVQSLMSKDSTAEWVINKLLTPDVASRLYLEVKQAVSTRPTQKREKKWYRRLIKRSQK
ncbi:hypothetical protein PG985_009850 [Apiospora marii]|uniref:uncharacterized protein n=1 Tax=Apiospora marii TaxID=335849 RepID=UPI00313237A6